jgi:hypothetical protein
MEMVHEAEVNYEVRLAAISDRSDSPQLAVEYVDGLRPCYEWEGMSDCPESEALFAEKYQAAHPAGPFSGYLPLLAAHRWLCVAEVFDTELRPNDATRVRNSSQKWLQIAVQSPLRLVRVAAEQLSRRGRCHSPA